MIKAKEKDMKRFWDKVDLNGDCWLWLGNLDRKGYGRFSFNVSGSLAHRFSYMVHVGPIGKGLTIDHICRVRKCVNPSHLRVLTNTENVLSGIGITATNARKTSCNRGHEYTKENTRIFIGPNGRKVRFCKACDKIRRPRYALSQLKSDIKRGNAKALEEKT